MKTRFILFLLCAFFIPISAQAGSKIHEFDLDSDFTINVEVLKFAAIQLEKGEVVPDGHIFLGDNRWAIASAQTGEGDDIRKILIVKPMQENIPTTLGIATTKRMYNLNIDSDPKKEYHHNVKFNYPGKKSAPEVNKPVFAKLHLPGLQGRQKTEKEDPPKANDLNFDYSYTCQIGFKSKECKYKWTPKHIFDDGKKTFIYFPKNIKARSLPVLYALNENERQIINYRYDREKQRYTVDGVYNNFLLVIGNGSKEKLEITNNKTG